MIFWDAVTGAKRELLEGETREGFLAGTLVYESVAGIVLMDGDSTGYFLFREDCVGYKIGDYVVMELRDDRWKIVRHMDADDAELLDLRFSLSQANGPAFDQPGFSMTRGSELLLEGSKR